MITASLKVFVFAASGYMVLKGVLWLFMTSMSDEELTRIAVLPRERLKEYLPERHKGIFIMSLLELVCRGVAVGALIVAAVTWAMSL
jgi:hypothetical protein